MGPAEIIVPIVILLIVGGAVAYIIHAKKSGKKCIGCPDSGSCGKGTGGCSGACQSCSCCCSSTEDETDSNN